MGGAPFGKRSYSWENCTGMFSSRKGFWNVNLIKVLEKWFTVAIL
jgi:hypothetical protein